jgi:hypothetical protein
MNALQNETDNSPGNIAAEHADEEAWSGEDDASEEDGADASGKRKRQRLGRPLSVSCELCKSRKVGVLNQFVKFFIKKGWREMWCSIMSEVELTSGPGQM